MTVQIAVKLPDELVGAVDRLVAGGAFASRSQAVRSGLEALVIDRGRRTMDDGFRAGFQAAPETSGELAEATRLAEDAIREEPWDPWW